MMGFSSDWDRCYSNNAQMSVWPWSDVVSLVQRFCKPWISKEGAAVQVLEMGCGAGANIPFFKALGCDYKGIDGSLTIVELLHRRYPDLRDSIVCGDFTSVSPFSGSFDLVLDRAAFTHNDSKSIEQAIAIVFDQLRDGGVFIGVDWFSTKHTDFGFGIPSGDYFTRTKFIKGQFTGVGKVHFSDEAHLRELFKNFEIVLLEEKTLLRSEPRDKHQFASWNIVVRKASA